MTKDLRAAILAGDTESFKAALAPDVVWVGVLPGMLCRNRDDVTSILDGSDLQGRRFSPEIVAESEGRIVVDPHADPPPDLYPHVHQVLVIEDDQIVEMRDYPDRQAALAALETPW